MVRSAAASLSKMGVREGDCVTIVTVHTPETIALMYACGYVSATANMAYLSASEDELLDMFGQAQSKAVFALDAALERAAKATCLPVVSLEMSDSMPLPMRVLSRMRRRSRAGVAASWPEFLSLGRGTVPPEARDSGLPAFIVYTSGTTGQPKGAVLTSHAVNSVISQVERMHLDLRRGLVTLHAMPAFLAFGIEVLHLSLCNGLRTQLGFARSAEEIGGLLIKSNPDYFVGGPAMLRGVMRTRGGTSPT